MYAATDIQPGGITEGDPITHQRFGLGPLKNTLETGQLDTVVDPIDLPGGSRLQGFHIQARLHRHGDDIRQVIFTLGIVAGQLWQAIRQKTAGTGKDTGVDLLDTQFGIGGIFLFDDALDVILAITDDTAIAAGVIQGKGHQCQRVVIHTGDKFLEGFWTDERYVAVEHQDDILADQGHRLGDSMARSELFCLFRPLQVMALHGLLYLVTTMSINHDRIGHLQAGGCIDDVLNHRFACHFMENLGQGALHACALACRENDYR